VWNKDVETSNRPVPNAQAVARLEFVG